MLLMARERGVGSWREQGVVRENTALLGWKTDVVCFLGEIRWVAVVHE